MKKVHLIANPQAGNVRPELMDDVRLTLGENFTLQFSETSERADATRLARNAVGSGVDAVIALGGDGTVNEVAQALVHTDVALGIIPTGTTNVMARSLGIPPDVANAIRFVRDRLDARAKTRINVGRVDDRYFLFGAGMGLDAEVIRSVEAKPDRKRRFGHMFFLKEALSTAKRHRGTEPAISMRVDEGEPEMVLLALIANAGPFTYFGRRPLHVFPHVELNQGLDAFGLSRIGRATVPRLAWSFFVSRSHLDWRHTSYHHDVSRVDLRALLPLPVEVDGDYIGEWDQVSVSLIPRALDLLV